MQIYVNGRTVMIQLGMIKRALNNISQFSRPLVYCIVLFLFFIVIGTYNI